MINEDKVCLLNTMILKCDLVILFALHICDNFERQSGSKSGLQ